MTIENILLSTLLLILIQIFIPVTIDLFITKKLNFLAIGGFCFGIYLTKDPNSDEQ